MERTTPANEATPPGVEVAAGVYLPDAALRFSFARSSGPGGQNVNKLATKVRLHVALAEIEAQIGAAAAARLAQLAGASRLTAGGDLVVTSDESRSQRANRQACLDRLRELLVRAMRPPRPRRATRPSAATRRRRLETKQRRAQIKEQRRSPRGDA